MAETAASVLSSKVLPHAIRLLEGAAVRGEKQEGRHANTIRTGHHRKLPGLQDAGRTYFLRSAAPPHCNTFETSSMRQPIPRERCCLSKDRRRAAFLCLCKGRVKLSICSTDGKTLILKIAEPGEVLGLSATVSGKALRVDG